MRVTAKQIRYNEEMRRAASIKEAAVKEKVCKPEMCLLQIKQNTSFPDKDVTGAVSYIQRIL